jgi:hypothetical protein
MDAKPGVAGSGLQDGAAVGAVASRVAGGAQMNRLFKPHERHRGVRARKAELLMPRGLVLCEAKRLHDVFSRRAGTQRLTFELTGPLRHVAKGPE